MQVKININNIGKHIDSHIENELEKNNLPNCLGRLGIPAVRETILVDSEKLFKNRHASNAEDILSFDITQLIQSQIDADILENMALSKKGYEYIEERKEMLAHSVVTQLAKCVTCKYIDKCHKITQNYLRTLSILRY